jgi:molecular chaperone GrpE
LAAEFENYKKRNMRQFDDAVQNAEAEVFSQILEIFDNCRRALELPENQKNFETFKAGMKMIYEQMKKFLDKHKIESIKSVGQKFNPDLHEAVMQIETDEHPEGTVASELGSGFKRGEKVIRHAKVGVSKGKTKK